MNEESKIETSNVPFEDSFFEKKICIILGKRDGVDFQLTLDKNIAKEQMQKRISGIIMVCAWKVP